MVKVECKKCARSYNVKSNLVGKRIKCKGCGEAITVVEQSHSKPAPKASNVVVHIECGTCFSTYKVKPDLIGKRIKCKGCGELITVEEEPQARALAKFVSDAEDDTASHKSPEGDERTKLRKKQLKALKAEIKRLEAVIESRQPTLEEKKEMVLERADAMIAQKKADVMESKARRSLRGRASQALGAAAGGALFGEAGVSGMLGANAAGAPSMSKAKREEYDRLRNQAAIGGADLGMDVFPHDTGETTLSLAQAGWRLSALDEIACPAEKITWKVKVIANLGLFLHLSYWLLVVGVSLALSFIWPPVGVIALLIGAFFVLFEYAVDKPVVAALRDYPFVIPPARVSVSHSRLYYPLCISMLILSFGAVAWIILEFTRFVQTPAVQDFIQGLF
jgi:hypothetical protein